ncbi:unnamed protein product [Ilex paraguariensis]|uniref:EB1 C-terminal domain-containing protein n=1 Tax=Ilex paraguariensis TaxID=185542 RepID=A0ABC8T7N4_9AQUA
MERREACKGGKDVSKKFAQSQSSAKCAVAPARNLASHNARRNDAPSLNTTNQSVKASRPSSGGGPSVCSELGWTAYEQKITELKLSVDSLEKERDFYFAKLREIEILCQSREIGDLSVVEAIQRILYAMDDDDASVVAEAQAMISEYQHQAEPSSSILEVEEDLPKSDNQKRKTIINLDVDVAVSTTLSPRQRIFDVHSSGSPLMTY